jgi:hypothetical protein
LQHFKRSLHSPFASWFDINVVFGIGFGEGFLKYFVVFQALGFGVGDEIHPVQCNCSGMNTIDDLAESSPIGRLFDRTVIRVKEAVQPLKEVPAVHQRNLAQQARHSNRAGMASKRL